MTWTCRLIEKPELDERGNVDIERRAIGDMWFLDVPAEELKERHLSDQYFATNAGRQPLVVLLPGRTPDRKTYFLIDGKCYSAARGYYDGWRVSGRPPLITVEPSINIESSYHGFLRNGVISDPV